MSASINDPVEQWFGETRWGQYFAALSETSTTSEWEGLENAVSRIRDVFTQLNNQPHLFQAIEQDFSLANKVVLVATSGWVGAISAALLTSVSPLGGMIFLSTSALSAFAIDSVRNRFDLRRVNRTPNDTLDTIKNWVPSFIGGLAAGFAVSNLLGGSITLGSAVLICGAVPAVVGVALGITLVVAGNVLARARAHYPHAGSPGTLDDTTYF